MEAIGIIGIGIMVVIALRKMARDRRGGRK